VEERRAEFFHVMLVKNVDNAVVVTVGTAMASSVTGMSTRSVRALRAVTTPAKGV